MWVQGGFSASLAAAMVQGTVIAIQRCATQDGTFVEVNRWTMDGATQLELYDEDKAGAWYRIGVPTGGYVSGTLTPTMWRHG